jgi:two-component system chemotaxis response regulator CheY
MPLKSSMKILLVDSAATNRQSLKKVFSSLGFKNIIEAIDGETAWKKIEEAETPVELIVSEWELPKISGLELLQKVRATEKYKATKFLMITGEAAQQNIIIAVKNGVSNVMVRPFSANTVTEKLAKIYNQK